MAFQTVVWVEATKPALEQRDKHSSASASLLLSSTNQSQQLCGVITVAVGFWGGWQFFSENCSSQKIPLHWVQSFLWKCWYVVGMCIPAGEFSQHQEQALQLAENSPSRIACRGWGTFLLLARLEFKAGACMGTSPRLIDSELPWGRPPFVQMKLRMGEVLKPCASKGWKRVFHAAVLSFQWIAS